MQSVKKSDRIRSEKYYIKIKCNMYKVKMLIIYKKIIFEILL